MRAAVVPSSPVRCPGSASRRLFTQRDFPPACAPCSEVVPQPLRTGLADVELRADRADRGNAIRCQLIGEYLGRLLLSGSAIYPLCWTCRPAQPENRG